MRNNFVFFLAVFLVFGRDSRCDQPDAIVLAGQVLQGDQPQPQLTVRLIGTKAARLQLPSLTSDGQLIDPWQEIATCQTDASGRYRLEVPPAIAQGFLKIELPENKALYRSMNFRGGGFPYRLPSFKDQQILVPNFVPCRIRVLDSKQTPIAGAAVRRMPGFRQGVVLNPNRFVDSKQTDADGYALVMLEPGEIQSVWVIAKGYLRHNVVVRPENPSASKPLDVAQNVKELKVDEIIELVLAPAKSIRGRIVSGPTGMAVSEARVLLEPSSDPRARLQLPPGAITASTLEIHTDNDGRFSLPEFPNLPFHVYASQDGKFFTRQSVNPADGTETDLGDLELGEGDVVRGQLLDVDTRSPVDISDGKVEVSDFHGAKFTADVDPNGAFACPVPKAFGGQARLMEHPEFEASPYYGFNNRSNETAYPLYVHRRPPQLGDSEVLELLPEFLQEYRVPDGKILRRVSRPFSPAREAFYQTTRFRDFLPPMGITEVPWMHMRSMSESGKPSSPFSAIYLHDDQNRLRVLSSNHGIQPGYQSVHQMLTSVFVYLGHSRIRNTIRPDAPPLPLGDFVFRTRQPLEDVVEALNESFLEEPQVPIKLAIVQQRFMTLIVHDRPSDEKFYSAPSLKLVPVGYDGPTRTGNYQLTWARAVGHVANELGIQWKSLVFDDQRASDIRIETPTALNGSDQKSRSDMQLKMRENAAQILQNTFGVKAEIQEIDLPVVVITPSP